MIDKNSDLSIIEQNRVLKKGSLFSQQEKPNLGSFGRFNWFIQL